MAVYAARRKTSSLTNLLFGVVGLLLIAAAIVGVLASAGLVDLASLWRKPAPTGPVVPPGMMMVPLSSRPLVAYSKMTRDDMWNTTTGQFAQTPLGPEYVYLGLTIRPGRSGQLLLEPGTSSPAAEAGVLSGDELQRMDGKPVTSLLSTREALLQKELGDLVQLSVARRGKPMEMELTIREYVLSFGSVTGRVLDRDKTAGTAFRETDFLPDETREGLVAGIPPGMRGLTFEATKLVGVHGLRIKDRVDLIANVPIARLSDFDRNQSTALGPGGRLPHAELAVAATAAQPTKVTEARVLTKAAVIVTPVVMRPMPTTDTTVFGSTTRNSPVQQLTIAVDEDDAASVTEAISAGYTIQCVALSGVPGDESKPIPADMVAVPISGRTILANLRMTHADLVDPRTREQRFIHLPREGLDKRGVVTDPVQLLGRVLTVDKPAGELFLQEELAPIGTPEGLAGALPAGRRSFTIDAAQLEGASQLRRGDHFDIIASLPFNIPAGIQTSSPMPSTSHDIRVLVQDGIVLSPVGAPETQPIAIGGQGGAGREVILGVTPEEVSILVHALQMKSSLTAIFRSRQKDGGQQEGDRDTEVAIPNIDPLAGISLIEVLVGDRRGHWMSSSTNASRYGGLIFQRPFPASKPPAAKAENGDQSALPTGRSHVVAKPITEERAN
jgi:membrane-associated protease RseP (regulator of RpoE activity)